MIYASDLDRTLIYSESFLNSYPDSSKHEKLLIDKSKVCSYIDKEVAAHLGYITNNSDIIFVPVTTRSIQEFRRIRFKEHGIKIDYAITSNGGTILYKDNRLEEWEEYIRPKINIEELNSIVDSLNKLDLINYESRVVDNSFVFTKYNTSLADADGIKSIISQVIIADQHYDIFIYKSKVYVIPKCIRKDNTLLWLLHYLKEEEVVSSGDSAFDLPMLNIANLSIIPGHSSIGKENLKNCKYIEISSGIRSPLETINIIKSVRGIYNGSKYTKYINTRCKFKSFSTNEG